MSNKLTVKTMRMYNEAVEENKRKSLFMNTVDDICYISSKDFKKVVTNKDGSAIDPELIRKVESGEIDEFVDENRVTFRIKHEQSGFSMQQSFIDQYRKNIELLTSQKNSKLLTKVKRSKGSAVCKIQNGAADEYYSADGELVVKKWWRFW